MIVILIQMVLPHPTTICDKCGGFNLNYNKTHVSCVPKLQFVINVVD